MPGGTKVGAIGLPASDRIALGSALVVRQVRDVALAGLGKGVHRRQTTGVYPGRFVVCRRAPPQPVETGPAQDADEHVEHRIGEKPWTLA